ncbi:MAG: methyltransferase domain-containing protein [Rickettsiales bacterium]|nr:methyltransferase domain-containing protein [Rickettsiales bacterium]
MNIESLNKLVSIVATEYQIFNRSLLRKRRSRIINRSDESEFLFQASAQRMIETFETIKRKDFASVLEIGVRKDILRSALDSEIDYSTYVATDSSYILASHVDCENRLVMDEEYLPFKEKTFDLIVSNLTMHWINDLPGYLTQVRKLLKEDGVFVSNFIGETSFHELKQALISLVKEGEIDMRARVSPFVTVKDAGLLLQRAGFKMPVSNVETIILTYDRLEKMFKDIHDMAEGSCFLKEVNKITTKGELGKISRKYSELFEGSGEIPVTIDIISLIGWA